MIVRLVNIVLGVNAREPFVAELANNIDKDITRARIKPPNAIGNCLKQKRALCHDALMVHKIESSPHHWNSLVFACAA